jgi:hypothetical protein
MHRLSGLRGLLIKVQGWVGQFNGEQSLYAGVQVEGFTGA